MPRCVLVRAASAQDASSLVGGTMLHPRPALTALATVLAVALGITAAVLTTHRPTTATGGAVITTQLTDTTAPPATTSPPAGPRTHGPTQPTPQPPTTSPRISDPALAARQVFEAWQAHNRQRALQAATPSVVRTLFAFAPTQGLRFTGCRFLSLGYDCGYLSADVGLYYIGMRVQAAPPPATGWSPSTRRGAQRRVRDGGGRAVEPLAGPQPPAALHRLHLPRYQPGLRLRLRLHHGRPWVHHAGQGRRAPGLARRGDQVRPTVIPTRRHRAGRALRRGSHP